LPERRASERPIAIACFGLVTFLPVPLFSLPRLNSCISFFTFLPAEGEYLRPDEDFFEADFLLLDFLLLELFFAEDFFVDVLRALPLLRVLLVFFALLFRALLLLALFRAVDFFAPDDFFALFFLAAFFVAIHYPPSKSDGAAIRDSCMAYRQPSSNCMQEICRIDKAAWGRASNAQTKRRGLRLMQSPRLVSAARGKAALQ
jgi:hypothetical protein